MRQIGKREQRTLARSARVEGTGFITGAEVCLKFHPAPPSTGVTFVRSDLSDEPRITAHHSNVTGTSRRTTLGHPPKQVTLVEHVLAALAGLRIDNCLVELNAPEPPGLDGSAQGFAKALQSTGVVVQPAQREIWTVDQTVTVAQGDATLSLHPASGHELLVSYHLQYAQGSPIVPQRHTHDVTPEGFCTGLADSRTFLLEQEAEMLRKQGLGSKTSLSDLIVFGPRGPIENQLRYGNEPARHKILDIVGDLSLLGVDLRGHVVGCCSGHTLNAALVKRLVELMTRSEREPLPLAA